MKGTGGEVTLARDAAPHVADVEVGAVARAVSHNPAPNRGKNLSQFVVVVAGHDHAVERHVVEEFNEGTLDVGQVAVAVHVFAVDVGDDGKDRPELEKGAVAFVGFGDEILGLADAGVGTHGVHATADDHGGGGASGSEDGGYHRGRGGLAVHSGDGDAVLQPHQFGHHLGAWNHGNVIGMGGSDFGVVACDGGAGDDDFRAGEVLRAMALEGDG